MSQVTVSINIYKPPVPSGYSLMRVRKWGEPVMSEQGDFDIYKRYASPDTAIGTFQVVELYKDPIKDWSAITCFNTLTNLELIKVAQAQLRAFGHSDWDAVRDMEKPLRDGYSLKQKMGWMYQNWSGGPATLTMWGSGEWWEPGEKRFGIMVSGGGLVAVSNTTYTFSVRLRGYTTVRPVVMRKILPFRRADLEKNPLQYPYLWQKASCVYKNNNFSDSTPKGVVYLPVALDWREFPINSVYTPTGYYIPVDWLTNP
jgi:hypothetical protein